MSAERGWIGEPQEPREWHEPSWVNEPRDRPSHFHTSEEARRKLAKRLAEQEEGVKRVGVGSVFLAEFDVKDDDCTPPGNQ